MSSEIFITRFVTLFVSLVSQNSMKMYVSQGISLSLFLPCRSHKGKASCESRVLLDRTKRLGVKTIVTFFEEGIKAVEVCERLREL
jgi:hypothetical protein